MAKIILSPLRFGHLCDIVMSTADGEPAAPSGFFSVSFDVKAVLKEGENVSHSPL